MNQESDSKAFRVLLIEDSKTEAMSYVSVLQNSNRPSFRVEWAETLENGLERLKRKDIDLVLLDLTLPDSEGIGTYTKVHDRAPEVPIIVLTGLDDENVAMEALRTGAQDYVVKSEVDSKLLSRLMRYSIERKKIETQLKHANEQLAKNEVTLLDMLQSLKRSNQELRVTRLQLIQAEKMEVIGRLAAGVAHEVKNPLALLRMGVDYFSQDLKNPDQKKQFILKSMSEAIIRADNVIREMLDFSSLSDLDIHLQKIEDIIDHSLLLIKHELDKNHVRLIKEYQPNLAPVKLDKNRMEQVFVNLLSNAVDAMKGPGELKITVTPKKLDTVGGVVGYRSGDVFSPGDVVAAITIEDTGRGIPEDMLPKIFDPFFTTKRSIGGTGLGLTIVRNIIQMHHGHIEITNKEDKTGARVTIMLRMS